MKNRNKSIGVRVCPDLFNLVVEVSTARGEDVSVFVRRALRKELATLSYFPDDVKKALGVTTNRIGEDDELQ